MERIAPSSAERSGIRRTRPGLIISDLDGTLVVSDRFYSGSYSRSLTEFVREKRGDEGLSVLAATRARYGGRGELALFALDLDPSGWAKRLSDLDVGVIDPAPRLVDAVRSSGIPTVVYTGSPVRLAGNVLTRLGFDPASDFADIVAWDTTERFPVKWTTSALTFEAIARKWGAKPETTWAIGDSWATDLAPAQSIGMRTAAVEGERTDAATAVFRDATSFFEVAREGFI